MDTTETFEKGRTILKEGTKGTSAYIILSGAVEVVKHSGEGDIPMATLGEGQVFGEMGLIEDRPRSATVKALSEVQVRVIDRDDFNDLLRKKPSVLIPIMKGLFERLRQATEKLAERAGEGRFGAAAPARERAFEVVIEGQTAEAKEVLGDRKLLITKFPFLVGRYSLDPDSDVFYNNDLFVREDKPYQISRNHLAIVNEEGRVWVVDRGSAFGTIVNGREIGGASGLTRAPLDKKANQVIIGPVTSHYIFLLEVLPQ